MKKKHRGVSAGTVVMSMLTVAILGGSLWILSGLSRGQTLDLSFQEGTVSRDVLGSLPSLGLQDIPIHSGGETVSTRQDKGQDGEKEGQAVQPTEAPAGGTVTMTFGGTVALETAVRQSGYYSDSKRYDFSEILSLLAPYVRSDYAFAAVENLVVPDSKVSDLIAPAEIMGMFSEGGFNGVATGFSKAFDKGFDALSSTVLAAREAGLEALGSYLSEGEAGLSAQIHRLGNVNVAILHYTEALSKTGQKAMRKDGRNYALPLVSQAEQDIPIVRSLGADVVVVSVHWGSAGKTEVTKAQRSLAQRLAAAGADILVGAGSRRVQTVEFLEVTMAGGEKHRMLCAYSLGCLLSASTKAQALQGMLLHVTAEVSPSGDVALSASYTPTFIWRYRQENLMRYRVIASNHPAPDGMSEEQKQKMESARASVEKILKDTPLAAQ